MTNILFDFMLIRNKLFCCCKYINVSKSKSTRMLEKHLKPKRMDCELLDALTFLAFDDLQLFYEHSNENDMCTLGFWIPATQFIRFLQLFYLVSMQIFLFEYNDDISIRCVVNSFLTHSCSNRPSTIINFSK